MQPLPEVGSYTHSLIKMAGRDHNIKVRLTQDEHTKLQEKANKLRFSGLSAFLRYLIFSKEIKISFSPSEEELSRSLAEKNRRIGELNGQIAKIGVNINQVAKKVNSQQYVMREDMDHLLKKMKDIEEYLKQIRK